MNRFKGSQDAQDWFMSLLSISTLIRTNHIRQRRVQLTCPILTIWLSLRLISQGPPRGKHRMTTSNLSVEGVEKITVILFNA